MSTDMGIDARTDVIDLLFRTHASRVYGYVRLRAPADLADDVVGDTFLTAWRLRDSLPADPLPWLLVIARNALANRQRSQRRGARLVVAMATVERFARQAQPADDAALQREAALAALARLGADEREALLLTAWDGLCLRDAAHVADCSPRTFARRLARAREQLHQALDGSASSDTTPANTGASAAPAQHLDQKDQP